MTTQAETLPKLETRSRTVATIEEAREEIARLDAVEREQRARQLLKECRVRSGERERRQSADASRKSRSEAEREKVETELRERATAEMFERIKPFGTYDLCSLDGGRLIVALPEGEFLPRKVEIQRLANASVDWAKPAYCVGHEIPDHVTRVEAVNPSDDDLVSLRV